MDDPTACWRRYLAAISAQEPDEDEATQALLELVQLATRGRPAAGRVHSRRDQSSRGAALVMRATQASSSRRIR